MPVLRWPSSAVEAGGSRTTQPREGHAAGPARPRASTGRGSLVPSGLVEHSELRKNGDHSARARPDPASSLRPTDPALRANPFPEVTDPVCRLPLPTLFRRPEAANLGDLLRIRVRPGARLTWSPRGFQGSAVALRTPQSRGAFRLRHPFLRASRFQGHEALQRKENSSRGHRRRPPLRSRRRTASSARREAVLRVRVREC